MPPKVAMSESGTATLGMIVALQLRRNMKTTITTSATLSTRVSSTSCTEARMVCARSSPMPMVIAGEIEVLRLGSSAVTRSMVSMMLAPGWRRMTSTTEGLLLIQPATRVFCTPSMTVATSPRRTAAPFWYETMSLR